MTPRQLAAKIEVRYKDLEPLLDDRNKIADMDSDEVWWKISRYADVRLGNIMAIRHELNRALQADRGKRIARVAAQRRIEPRSSPRDR